MAINNGALKSGRSYRLHVYIHAVGESYKEYQYYDFTTNLPPSLGQCYVSPESGMLLLYSVRNGLKPLYYLNTRQMNA